MLPLVLDGLLLALLLAVLALGGRLRVDLRRLHRRILNTLAYQRDWKTNASNAKDERNFSHRKLRRLTAEQALDAIAQITDTPVKIPKRYGSPRDGQKAVEIALSRVGAAASSRPGSSPMTWR
jgi:hypothetical protein